MVKARKEPYIWASWLAKMMSGDTTCHWQSWFQSQNQLTEKQPSDFDLASWKIRHTKMLTKLKQELIEGGYKPQIEQSFKYKIPHSKAVVAGKIDCIAEAGDKIFLYDCKSGKERISDQIQVMIYIFLLSKGKYSKKDIFGEVIYNDKKVAIPGLSEDFEENFNFFVNVLSSKDPPSKNSGDDCRFCNLTKKDCPERLD